ncbi:hypothetical protein [Fimbriiglobus ruber]|uniref:hypothetical protein n=1 Tax=Fimbriiglobus ruber TaxID=1908690 RepID=UPI00117A0EBA|nr:hypothetical protein [Fimbriiglobus ruber]
MVDKSRIAVIDDLVLNSYDDLNAILAEVSARPSEDEPRLRYAQMLAKDDRRKQEARFIEVQCELAQIASASSPPTTPEGIARFRQLHDEEQALFSRWGREKTNEYKESFPGLHKVVYRRGFPSHFIFDDASQFDRYAEELSEAAPLLEGLTLDLGERYFDFSWQADKFFDLPILERVDALSLRGKGWNDQAAESLASSTRVGHLKALNLSACDVGPDGLREILISPNLPQVKSLEFSNNSIPIDVVKIFSDVGSLHPALHFLWLNDCGLDDAGATELASTPALETLKELHLEGNPLSPVAINKLLDSPYLNSVVLTLDTEHLPQKVGQLISRRTDEHNEIATGRNV